ncbi:MAG: hypothetical protein QM811_31325 [Pirellulales bacterium]
MTHAPHMRLTGAELYFLPVTTRVPLKFGGETLTAVSVARVKLNVRDDAGRTAIGWGESPLSVQWGWPSNASYAARHDAMTRFCRVLGEALLAANLSGHALEIGSDFQERVLPGLLSRTNSTRPETLSGPEGEMPLLAALLCLAPWDSALHDAYGRLVERDVYETYGPEFLSRDLSAYLAPAIDTAIRFAGRYPRDYFVPKPPRQLRAWHLVGGLDPLDRDDLRGDEPNDGYPVLLSEWIERDGLACLKIKLRGNDAAWDYDRIVHVGRIAVAHGVEWLTTDFNCTVLEPSYVDVILDRLRDEHPRLYGMLLYVEQPFPYELDEHPLDVHSTAARKPLFLDESAHDWRHVRRGRELGWNGVALKTCKTQTGALLAMCWAKAHGMSLMVQDLTNPMLAQIPHVRLAAHAGTIMGVETNAMQFYPAASDIEARIHPGLYRRSAGRIDLGTLAGPGFGYREAEIARELPSPDWVS